MKYNVFDVKFKIDNVKKFLDLREHGPFKIGYGSYAKSINVNKATFVAWVKKYQDSILNYCDTNSVDQTLMVVNSNSNDFINLCEDEFEVVDTGDNTSTTNTVSKDTNKNMSLKINGGVIEFDPSNLKKVIEVLKSC